MTYDQAQKWLRAIGGEMVTGRETADKGSVIVVLKSAKDGEVSRHALFDGWLEGPEREMAIRQAFVTACEELRLALG